MSPCHKSLMPQAQAAQAVERDARAHPVYRFPEFRRGPRGAEAASAEGAAAADVENAGATAGRDAAVHLGASSRDDSFIRSIHDDMSSLLPLNALCTSIPPSIH